MADVKRFKLSDGTIVNVKDSTARTGLASVTTTIGQLEAHIYNMERDRAILCIGDSYLGGSQNSSPTTENWGYQLARMFGLTDGIDYFHYYTSGGGFMKSSDYNFYGTVQTAIINMSSSNRNKITDIIIGGGANDHQSGTGYENTMSASFSAIKTAIASNFQSDVKVHVVAMGWNAQYELRKNLFDTYDLYARLCAENGFIYHECFQLLQNRTYFNSDGVHPVATAQVRIAQCIANFIKGSSFPVYTGNKKWNLTVNGTVVGHAYVVNNSVVLKFLNINVENANTPQSVTSWRNFGVISSPVLLGGLSNSNLVFTIPVILNSSTTPVYGIAETWIYKTAESASLDELKIDFKIGWYNAEEAPVLSEIKFLENSVTIPMPIA